MSRKLNFGVHKKYKDTKKGRILRKAYGYYDLAKRNRSNEKKFKHYNYLSNKYFNIYRKKYRKR